MASSEPLLRRSVTTVTEEYMQAFRVLVLNGPRQSGKTTLMRQLNRFYGGDLRNLDSEPQLEAALEDPLGYVAGATPLYIDEVQRAGEALVRAVKLAVDADPAPGQFVLAGSTRFLAEPSLSESLAGRAGVVEVHPFSQGEIEGRTDAFLETVFETTDGLLKMGSTNLTRIQYLERIVRGGFPEACRMSNARAREAWFANYVRAVTERDIREMARVNLPSAAGTVLRGVAAMSSQLLQSTTLAAKADLPRSTVDRYLELLEAVFMEYRIRPWSRNPLLKAVKHPKAHLVDSGLLCYLLGVNAQALASPTSPTLGAVVETFVVNELRKQASWSQVRIELFHYRDVRGDSEIDVIAEAADGRVVGFEVKAAMTVTAVDFRALTRLATKLGGDFVHGFVVYLGPDVLSFGTKLTAVPLGALWRWPA